MKTSLNSPTKYEQARIDAMRHLGCVACAILGVPNLNQLELHHILSGGVRMGHWFTLFLCRGHHQGDWSQLGWIRPKKRVAISDGRKRFTAVYGTERVLWERVQTKLKLPTTWPVSKILPRRLPHVDDLRAHTHHADPAGVLAGGERNALLSGNACLGLSQPGLGDPLEDAAAVFVGLPAGGPGDAS